MVERLFPGVVEETLVFACSPSIRPHVELEDVGTKVVEFEWHGDESRDHLVSVFQSDEPVTVLWLTDSEFKHFTSEELGPARIAGWTFFSSGVTPDGLAAIIEATRNTNYERQLEIEEALLGLFEDADALHIIDRRTGTVAQLAHQQCEYWFSLHGPIGRAQQTVLPTGELSILTDPSGEFTDRFLPMDGEVTLQGETLVHRGDSGLGRAEAAATYKQMSVLANNAVIATIEDGLITDVRPVDNGAVVGAEALLRLFSSDERYRKIHELGIGTNEACRPLRRGNFLGDERHPGVHFGLGLGRHLNFHFDIVCPDSTVVAVSDTGDTDTLAAVGLLDPPMVPNRTDKL